MKSWIVPGIIGLLMVAGVGYIVFLQSKLTTASPLSERSDSTLRMTSDAFTDGAPLPIKYTCDAENLVPPLALSGVPGSAQSLALTLDDPDAQVGVWDHWVVFDISPTTTVIREGSEPDAPHGRGTAGNRTYAGPCPPQGMHHYVFTLYALDTLLHLPVGITKSELLVALRGHVLAKTVLTGTYTRH